jgi:hypothetical protein
MLYELRTAPFTNRPAAKAPAFLSGLIITTLAMTQAFGFTGGYSIGLHFGADEPSASGYSTLNPTDQAGVPAFAQKNWNNYTGATSTSPQPIVADKSGTQVTTSATVEWVSIGTWASGAGGGADRGEHNNGFAEGPDKVLMTGYLDTGAPTTTTVTIHSIPSDLTANGYNVIVYLLGGVSGRGGGYRVTDLNDNEIKPWKLGDPPSNPSTYVEDPGLSHTDTGDYMVFTGLTATDIKVVATTDFGLGFGGTQRAPLNAVELVPFTGQKAPNFHTPIGNPIGFTMAIEDFAPIIVDTNTVTVAFDTQPIQPTVTKPAGVTTITYDLFAAKQQFLASGSQHTVLVNLKDTTGKAWSSTNSFTVPNYPSLDPATKLASPATTPGMSTYTYQISVPAAWRDENLTRDAEMRLVGGKVDPLAGKPYPNVAEGTVTNVVQTVNWERAATDVAGEFFGSATTPPDTAIPNDYIPGIPASASSTDHVTVETLTYLRFPAAGLYRMGVASDDGFLVTAGQPGPLGLLIGTYDGGRSVGETSFEFAVPVAGDYPFRLLYWNGTGGANCEWYLIDRQTGTNRYLINGPQNNPLALKAFTTGQSRAYVKSVSPANNYYFVDAKAPVKITLVDGSTQVASGSVKLALNGTDVTSAAVVQKSGSITTVTYAPANGLAYDTTFNAQVIWQETTTPPTTQTNTFQFAVGGPLPYEFPTGSFWIEAEDFDNNGKEATAVDTMPYTGDGMSGLGAVALVDYNNDDATTDTATIYRFANGDGSTPLTPYVDIATSTTAMLAIERPQGTTMTANYKIGWSSGADWYNYTRAIPQGLYTAYAALSYDSGEDSPFSNPTTISASLGKVTAGVGTQTQTVQSFGAFTGPSSGGWSANNLVPLTAPDGSAAVFKINSATTTFRVTVPSGDWDYFALMPLKGVSPKIVAVSPANLSYSLRRDATLSWTVEDFSTTLDKTSVSLTVDGVAVPPATLTVAPVAGTTDQNVISYKPATLLDIGKAHAYALSFKASDGTPTTSSGTFMANYLPETPAGSFWIEAEDFNYGGGKSNPQKGVAGLDVNVMPYLGNAYTNLNAVFNIDYVNNDTPTDSARLYRYVQDATGATNNILLLSQWGAIGTGEPTDVYEASVDIRTIAGGVTNSVTQGYRIGWADTGDWCDYTRTIPAGPYQAWAALSYGGAAPDQEVGWLYQVAGDVTTTNQTATLLGRFDGVGSGNWGVNSLVPLRTTASHDTQTSATNDAAVVSLPGGVTTLRFQLSSGDYDYFMLVPVGGTPPPSLKITGASISSGNITITWTGGGTLQTTTDLKTWADITGATTGTYSAAASASHAFYRVRQ